MGTRIAFWGPMKGQIATTSNVVAAASLIGTEYTARKTLLTHTPTNCSLERAFLKKNSVSEQLIKFTDSGLEGLARFARSGKLSPAIIRDYTNHIVHQMDILTGTGNLDLKTFNEILDNCQGYYDLSLIDVDSNLDEGERRAIFEESELAVVCLNQNAELLDRFFIEKEWEDTLKDIPYIIVLGQYDKTSHFTYSNIARKYKIKTPIYSVPRCANYLDAYNQNAVAEFFMRNRNIDRHDIDFFFFEEVKRLAKGIMSHTGLIGKIKSERGA
ncbi:chromosome partitioning protein ParA [Paenibacillus vini]|uniref:chromosome partitioning protein ParA n=1 Tax=Paenibacillus vini TaxID=1476024 RepID=UPI0025B72CEA|nr:chromosome partitioning protein ParA [Paenibacillus vini]MDN4067569.1 chromosome partitioning protein ParA [Paenibacillus vini]